MAVYTIKIPNWRPTPLNQIMGAHWAVGHKRKKADANIIRCYTRHLPTAECKRVVSLKMILGKGQRKFDDDAPWKSLLDALVQAKMLVDDSPKWCAFTAPEYERGEMPYTIITLTDI